MSDPVTVYQTECGAADVKADLVEQTAEKDRRGHGLARHLVSLGVTSDEDIAGIQIGRVGLVW